MNESVQMVERFLERYNNHYGLKPVAHDNEISSKIGEEKKNLNRKQRRKLLLHRLEVVK